MSGICGVWALDGREPDLGPVLAGLQRRGPDATREWRDGPVALGHSLLATTPEALVEQLPLTDAGSGFTITADVRLDNREELIAALGIASETRTIGDGELILRAYLLWGEDCPVHLLGDFAFAIWDPRAPRLFCARDHMGMRQLLYHHAPGRHFVFATEADALVAHPDLPKRVDEGRIADYLDDLEGIDFTSTLFEEVVRLPPATAMSVDAERVSLQRYWCLTPGPELRLDSDQAYANAFMAVFTEAVRCRLRSAAPVGSMLSGGMDSGTIVAVAARILAVNGGGPLRTFSAIGPDPATCAESGAIQAVLGLANIEATTVDHSALDALLPELWRLETETGEPFDQHMTLIRAVYLSARQRGINVMLDGAAGDVVLIAGNRLAAHLRRLRFRWAWTDACGEEAYWKIPNYRFRSFFGGMWVAFVPNIVRRIRRWLAWRIADLSKRRSGQIDKEFARRADLSGRRSLFRSHIALRDLADVDRRAEAISHPHVTAGRERYDRTAAAVGVEPRDPFLDVRVIEFCLSLPADQLQRGGWPKHLLRRATEGLLPDAIRWRLGKDHLGWMFTQRLFGAFPTWRTSLEAARPVLSRYVGALNDKRIADPGELERRFGLFVLARWLERNRH